MVSKDAILTKRTIRNWTKDTLEKETNILKKRASIIAELYS